MLAIMNWNDLAVVMTLGTFVMVWIIVILAVGTKLRRKSGQQAASPPAPAWAAPAACCPDSFFHCASYSLHPPDRHASPLARLRSGGHAASEVDDHWHSADGALRHRDLRNRAGRQNPLQPMATA